MCFQCKPVNPKKKAMKRDCVSMIRDFNKQKTTDDYFW